MSESQHRADAVYLLDLLERIDAETIARLHPKLRHRLLKSLARHRDICVRELERRKRSKAKRRNGVAL
jgi:hypothetical protein